MKQRHVEKICRKHVKSRPSIIRWLKRLTAKAWRRMAKEDPEDAPRKRPTRGWSD